ncbi:hypothetical protein L226DRAFT_337195 [Lentinus tigrinus ALCF2SS1-7]|uniref:DUF6535 domain-containing protein n=1 Tax=Lentinus tigrinus ALCF2SS1-6 TaxID=1328759 RepID=A0A5C2SEU5_9APHY|nr:hypothetical protein L227DRAFT_31248 [Lentinus tigrinus ALCF2SS1-6]RPD77948.1 hypothetical protein L226DRAFT_337195 [Lentinus tigrinus ALCF2SS1-7]
MSTLRPNYTEHVTRAGPAQIPIVCPFTDSEISNAWDKCAHTVQEHCDQMVKRWKEEIDMFLVFAGLFSAVLTAFTVQSWVTLLQEDKSETIASALILVSAQLHNFSTSGTSITSYTRTPFRVPRYAIWINALWFSSLILTLSASLIAIMVKQWLQQYSLRLSGNSHEVARLRQYRYESLLKWHVVGIMAMLPILLQAALILFLSGIVILLWSLHPVVAAIATFLVGLLLVFTSTTTILPAFHSDCFYQSPQALGVFLVVQTFRRLFSLDVKKILLHRHALPLFRSEKLDNFRNWHVREKAEVRAKRADLDRGLATKSYAISLDEAVLKNVVIPCLWDVSPECLTSFMEDIERTSNRYEPIVPCILNFMTLAARDPEPNRRKVRKLLAEAWWPRMEANSEMGELFVRTMATLASRGLEPTFTFYRVTQTLAYSASDGGNRIKPEVVEHLVSTWPNPYSAGQYASLIRNKDPKGLPLVLSYFQALPMLIRYLGRLVVDGPHEMERVQLQIDILLNTLQRFLMHVALTEDLSNLAIVLWTLRRSRHVEQMLSLKTDARCSPLVPLDILESYQDVLANIRAVATVDTFQAFFKKHVDRLDRILNTNLEDRESDPVTLANTLQGELNVLEKFFWMLPWQRNDRKRSGMCAVLFSHANRQIHCDAGSNVSATPSYVIPPYNPPDSPSSARSEAPSRSRPGNISANSYASSATKVSGRSTSTSSRPEPLRVKEQGSRRSSTSQSAQTTSSENVLTDRPIVPAVNDEESFGSHVMASRLLSAQPASPLGDEPSDSETSRFLQLPNRERRCRSDSSMV